MGDSNTAQRRHARIALELPVRLTSIDPERDASGATFYRATRERCANVSAGGACLRTADPLAPGSRVLLELELPDGQAFETLGRVAWSRCAVGRGGAVEAGCGVEFLGLSSEERAPLERWLAPGAPARPRA
jgi:uncharacterized protein (TIGR02266 family)